MIINRNKHKNEHYFLTFFIYSQAESVIRYFEVMPDVPNIAFSMFLNVFFINLDFKIFF